MMIQHHYIMGLTPNNQTIKPLDGCLLAQFAKSQVMIHYIAILLVIFHLQGIVSTHAGM